MSALRETTPSVGPGNGVPVSGRSPQARRPSAAKRSVGAAGAQRRSLQRDLARREANIRINRRVSGAPAGEWRPPAAAQPAAAQPAPVAQAPVAQAAVPAELPGWRPAPTAPAPAPSRPQPAPRRAAARPAAATSKPRPAARAATRPVPPAPGRPLPSRGPAATSPQARAQAPFGIGAATAAAAAATAPAPAPAPQPTPGAPRRPLLRALPGGALAAPATDGSRRLSTPAVLVTSFVILVLTVGAIVGVQIRLTQVNEQVGADLGKITALQQKTIAQKEGIARLVSAARVDHAAASAGLLEPTVEDVRYLSAGKRAATAARAARVLEKAPVAPTAAEAAAAAAALKASQAASAPVAQAAATAAPVIATGAAQ